MDEDEKLIFDRLFKQLDEQDRKLDDLCNRMTKSEDAARAVDVKIETHLLAQEKISQRKEKIFYIVIALIGLASGLFQHFHQPPGFP